MAVGILGTGSYLPAREVTNDELATFVAGADPEWVLRKTLIGARRFAAADEATSDLAAMASARALESAGIPAEEIDYLIVSTSTPDSPQPPTASRVQTLLGADRAAAFDVNVVCAGFVFALELGQRLVAARPGAKALVVAADVYSRILDFDDRRTAVLFGDGAGAVVLGAVREGFGIIDTELVTRGDAAELIHVDAGGSRMPASAQTLARGDHFFRMYGRGVAEFVAEHVPPVLDELLGRTGLHAKDVAHFVPHQANGVMLKNLVDAAGLDGGHTWLTLDRYGNTGSASVPVALDEAARSGSIEPGDIVLLAGFGGGMSVGAGVIRWGA